MSPFPESGLRPGIPSAGICRVLWAFRAEYHWLLIACFEIVLNSYFVFCKPLWGLSGRKAGFKKKEEAKNVFDVLSLLGTLKKADGELQKAVSISERVGGAVSVRGFFSEELSVLVIR